MFCLSLSANLAAEPLIGIRSFRGTRKASKDICFSLAMADASRRFSVSKALNARFRLSILRDKERNVHYPPPSPSPSHPLPHPMFHTSASGSTIIGRAAQFLGALFATGQLEVLLRLASGTSDRFPSLHRGPNLTRRIDLFPYRFPARLLLTRLSMYIHPIWHTDGLRNFTCFFSSLSLSLSTPLPPPAPSLSLSLCSI